MVTSVILSCESNESGQTENELSLPSHIIGGNSDLAKCFGLAEPLIYCLRRIVVLARSRSDKKEC